jgi:hypothetical protein
VDVKLTDAEFDALTEKAVRLKVSVPRLLVQAALYGGGASLPERHALYRELVDTRRELIRIGVNVNQLAHHANANDGAILPETSAALQTALLAMRQAEGVSARLPVPPVRSSARPTGEPTR